MANKRLCKEKQALVLAALCEGTPIEAVARMFKIGTNTIKRVIRETGEAFADYMDRNFAICHVSESKWMSNGSTSAVTLADFQRTTRQSAGIIGYGRALTLTRNLFSRIRLENAIGGLETRLLKTFAIA